MPSSPILRLVRVAIGTRAADCTRDPATPATKSTDHRSGGQPIARTAIRHREQLPESTPTAGAATRPRTVPTLAPAPVQVVTHPKPPRPNGLQWRPIRTVRRATSPTGLKTPRPASSVTPSRRKAWSDRLTAADLAMMCMSPSGPPAPAATARSPAFPRVVARLIRVAHRAMIRIAPLRFRAVDRATRHRRLCTSSLVTRPARTVTPRTAG